VSLPKITFEGRLTADPELRFTPSGKAVANFTIASNDRRKNDAGEWEDGAGCFIRCSIWDKAAENAAESLLKGMLVHAEGKLGQREYEKDGQKVTTYEAVLWWVAPSIKWGTARFSKTERAASAASAADPWQTPPAGQDDEPPF
jgi:single-strand DNA-binding protein